MREKALEDLREAQRIAQEKEAPILEFEKFFFRTDLEILNFEVLKS